MQPNWRTRRDRTLLGAHHLTRWRVPLDGQEYVHGWGVFALPFSSGHVLALRVFADNSFRRPYVAVWHRDPAGDWSIYVEGAPLDEACPRYFGAVCTHTANADIEVTQITPSTVQVRMADPALDWTLSTRAGPALRTANAVSRRLPAASWRPRAMVRMRELLARALGAGRIELDGVMPSGHHGRLMPEEMLLVDDATATLDGVDLGSPVRLEENPHIGGFPLPARGILVKGGAVWDVDSRPVQ
ncbi:MAG TPA: hypothetical protein VHZ06_09095 [Marmoricola sp.]|nr:hypothetical protein [Marmoricola sp.]